MMNSTSTARSSPGASSIVILCDNSGYTVIDRLQNFKGVPSFNDVETSRVSRRVVSISPACRVDGCAGETVEYRRRLERHLTDRQGRGSHHTSSSSNRSHHLDSRRCVVGVGVPRSACARRCARLPASMPKQRDDWGIGGASFRCSLPFKGRAGWGWVSGLPHPPPDLPLEGGGIRCRADYLDQQRPASARRRDHARDLPHAEQASGIQRHGEQASSFQWTPRSSGPILQRHGLKLVSGWFLRRAAGRLGGGREGAHRKPARHVQGAGCARSGVRRDHRQRAIEDRHAGARGARAFPIERFRDYGSKLTALAEHAGRTAA